MATKAHDGQLADGASGRILYVPGQTPVGGNSSDVDYDAHAKFSRFNIGIDNVTDSGDKAGAFLEMDFFGNALGNQASTNTYGVTVRHAYAYWNNWLAGQTWSNFMDTSALPDSVDFIGPTDGVVFVAPGPDSLHHWRLLGVAGKSRNDGHPERRRRRHRTPIAAPCPT